MQARLVQPVYRDMTLAQVANNRDSVMEPLAVTMKHLNNMSRQQARHVIVGTVEEAVKARIPSARWAARDYTCSLCIAAVFALKLKRRWLQQYGTIYIRFIHAAEAAGIVDSFTLHSLRHAFAMLTRSVSSLRSW